MKYLKRKVYATITFGIWLVIMHRLFLILMNSTALGDMLSISITYDSQRAAEEIFWYAPIWLILFIFWHVASLKEDWGRGGKLSSKQQNALMKAMNTPGSHE